MTRRRRDAGLLRGLVLGLALLLVAPEAFAQVGTDAPDPRDLDDATLEEDGWEFSRQRANPGSPGAGAFALTLGSSVHGSGHFLARDQRTGWRLLAMQGVGLSLFVTGAIGWSVSDGAAAREVATTMQAMGASVSTAAWLADVLGATKGSGADLPRNTRRANGLSGEFGFAALVGEATPVASTLRFALPWETRAFVLAPEVELSTDLDARRVGGYAAGRIGLSKRRGSFLELGSGGFDEWFGADGYGRTSIRGTILLSLDFGDFFRHLAHFVWENDLSIAVDYARFATSGGAAFRRSQRSMHLPFGFLIHTNLDQGVNLAVGYRHDRDRWVGTLSSRAGTIQGRLGIVPRNRLGIELRAEQGAYTRVEVGVRYVFASRD